MTECKYSYPFGKYLYVTDETTKLTPYTFSKDGIWEFQELAYFYQKVLQCEKNPCVIVDIGAQTGLYTLFAKFVENGEFYAYEPYKPCFDRLNDNIVLNEITNVKTFNMGISNTNEDQILKFPDHKGLSTFGQNPTRFRDYAEVKVKCDTLDNIFYETETPVDFIKCDTEGWEYNVLLGGIKTIKKYRPVMQLEYSPENMGQAGVTPEMFNDLIKDLGYECTHASREEFIYEFKNK